MKKRNVSKLSVLLCLILPLQMLPLSPVSTATAESSSTTDFFTSFEEGDPLPKWKNTVELDNDGNEKASGVIGSIPYDAIQGDITNRVEKITLSAENAPNELGKNLIDQNVRTKWLAFEKTATIKMVLSKPSNVIKYAFTSANDAEGRDPQAWTLYGSNDGENWTTIDEQKDQKFDKRFQRKVYEFTNEVDYKYYKFEITKNAGDGLTQLAEIALSNGVDAPPIEQPDMQTFVGDGPTSSYTAKTNVGWTGKKALTYEGRHTEDKRAYSYNKIFDVNIAVTEEAQLSYMIHPQFADKDELDYSSTFVSIDLAFTDGSYLSELGAIDQHGVELTPQAQGDSETLYPNQWNHKLSTIGEVAVGKTIDRILVAYDKSKGPGVFRGSIDDIKIEGNPEEATVSSPVDYVNILRGTNSNGSFSRGNNFPAVAVPHGFNFWTPATDAGSTSWLYTYQQDNNEKNLPELEAFSLSHEPSPWMGDRQTFQVMPSAAEGVPSADRNERALAFKHENEIAKPYYYRVEFENGIQTEMTPTNRAAMFTFTFTGNASKLIFDNVNNNGGLTLNPDNQSVSGYSDVKSGLSAGATRMFIYATFDQPIVSSGKLTGEGRNNVTGYVGFDTSGKNKAVTMKIATSLISVEQAKKNMEQDIKTDATFDEVKQRAKEQWNEKLRIIEVEGASKDELVTLYSNMYRLFLYPNIAYENTGTKSDPVYQYASPFSEAVGENTPTKTGANIVEGKPYVNNGFWDTYRTTWPAYSLLTPTEAGEMIDGFVQQYKDGGWIARWSSPGYANLMVGTSSDVAFADAYLKGVTNFDVDAFYESAVKNASVASSNASVGRKGLATSIFDGYTSTSTGEGLSWALDGYINDFAIANIAKSLAANHSGAEKAKYQNDYHYYQNRAQNYVNLFQPESEFFIGKNPDGEWRTTAEDFNPAEWGGDYTETNAWNMAFHAPQDGQGLANLYGGRDALADKLDTFFSTPETAKNPGHYGGIIHEMREARDVRMGMYGHSNQPSHHIPYMYNYAGQPWKTQEKVSEALSHLYLGSEIGQGYAGDEDNGEMSAWYIFSAAGFYPLQMGSPEYAIGAPHFKKMTIHLENGKDIVINAPNVSKKNKYVQGLKVNGKSYEKLSLSHDLLTKGVTLDFDMGAKPSDWGTSTDGLPPSITSTKTNGTVIDADPLHDLTTENNGVAYQSDKGVATKLFDNTSDTALTLKGKNPWVQFKFADESEMATMYTITSGKTKEEDPKSWELIGSNDGKEWTLLDKQTDVDFKWRTFTKPFTIENPGHYLYYRINVTENGGAKSTTFAEVELLGYKDLTDKFNKVEQIYQNYVDDGKISGALTKQLQAKFVQAQDQVDKGHYEQAVKKVEDALDFLDKDKKGKIEKDAKEQLKADLYALKDAVHKLINGASPGKGKWKYRDDVPQVPIFELTDLMTDSVEPGSDATVSVNVKNIGLLAGDKQVDFYFDGELIESETVTLGANESKSLSFTVPNVALGTHQVKVNNLTSSLKAIYQNKPVVSLSFEEENGTSVLDNSPYGFDGTIHGDVSRVEGKFGNALKLNGGWVEVPSEDLLNGGDEITIGVWVNLTNPSADQKVIGKTTIGNGYLLAVNGGLYPEIWAKDGAKLTFKQGEVPANQWTYLAISWKENGRAIGYINGEEVANVAAGSNPIEATNSPLIIGGAPWDPTALQTKGLVDEVKLYKKALSAEEIKMLYTTNSIE